MTDKLEHESRAVPDEGSLAETTMAELVYGLHAGGRSGVLRVRLEAVQKTIYVLDGRPVYVDSDLRSETLGAYLIRRGRLGEDDHRRLLDRMRETGRRQGELLIEAGLLGPHELYEALTEHQTEKVISCFAWQEGTFVFERGRSWSSNVLALPMEPLRIVLEGVRQHHGEDRLQPPLGLPDYVRPYGRKALLSSGSALALTTREARIRRAFDRGDPLSAIVAREGGELLSVARFLHALFLMDMVGFDLRRPIATPVPAPAPSAGVARAGGPAPAERSLADDVMADYLCLKDRDHHGILGLPKGAAPTAEQLATAFAEREARFRPAGIETLSPMLQAKAAELHDKLVEAREALSASGPGKPALTAAPRAEAAGRSGSLESDAAFRRAQTALAADRPREAVARLDEALQMKPGEPQYEAWLGWAIFLADPVRNRKKAERLLEQARRHDPRLPEPYLFMARLAVEDGQDERAGELYRKAASLALGDHEIGREAQTFDARLRKTGKKVRQGPPRAEAEGSIGNQDVGALLRRLLGRK